MSLEETLRNLGKPKLTMQKSYIVGYMKITEFPAFTDDSIVLNLTSGLLTTTDIQNAIGTSISFALAGLPMSSDADWSSEVDSDRTTRYTTLDGDVHRAFNPTADTKLTIKIFQNDPKSVGFLQLFGHSSDGSFNFTVKDQNKLLVYTPTASSTVTQYTGVTLHDLINCTVMMDSDSINLSENSITATIYGKRKAVIDQIKQFIS